MTPGSRGVVVRRLSCVIGLLAAALLVPTGSSRAVVADEPVHDVDVSGADLGMFPAFRPGVRRYAITSGDATGGTVTVTATSSDPGAKISVDGVPEPDGTRTVTGLHDGDEIAVFIEDSGGVARFSFIFLPADFPVLERVTPDSLLDRMSPGLVLLTLALFTAPSATYETAVDVNGVPAFVVPSLSSVDLQRQPNGSYSVFRPTSAPGRTGWDLVELDEHYQQVRTWRTVGLVNTDSHDAILLPDGTAWLMAYEPNPDTGLVDAVIQHVAGDGTLLFTWSSEPFSAETTTDPASTFGGDYAHINSLQLLPDGHVLASFRHLSAVFKIATHDDGAHVAKDVIWKLGGRDSDFTFPPGDGGPCAQHTARMLADGHVVLFDNGSWSTASQTLCVDPVAPTGPSVERPRTRVVELALDEANGTATPVSTYAPPGRFSLFAGSAQRLPNGSTMIGWASDTTALASEVSPEGEVLWEIRDPSASARFFSYRALKAEVPDATRPEVSVEGVADRTSYVEGDQVVVTYRCTDRGGSGLHSCGGDVAPGGLLDTSAPGEHTLTLTASDGAGGTTVVRRTYTVRPAARPDAAVRVRGTRRFVGSDVAGSSSSQRVRAPIGRPGGRTAVFLRLSNDGARADRLTFAVRHGSAWFRVAGRCATLGTTPLLAPGESWVCRFSVTRRASAADGRRAVIRVPVRSVAHPDRRDAVSVEVVAK